MYRSEACAKRLQRRGRPDKDPTVDLDEVRARHEESKGRWTVIVREHLNRTLLTTSYVSAEDFDALGIPDEHRNLANAQMGGYVRNGYMEPVTWRRSKKASRKSGKIWTHRITQKGREKLGDTAGVRVEHSSWGGHSSAGADSGGSPAPPDTGQGSPEIAAQAPPASGEPARLPGLDGPPRPLNPLTDAEAA